MKMTVNKEQEVFGPKYRLEKMITQEWFRPVSRTLGGG
jgi:hypothetical protein